MLDEHSIKSWHQALYVQRVLQGGMELLSTEQTVKLNNRLELQEKRH